MFDPDQNGVFARYAPNQFAFDHAHDRIQIGSVRRFQQGDGQILRLVGEPSLLLLVGAGFRIVRGRIEGIDKEGGQL